MSEKSIKELMEEIRSMASASPAIPMMEKMLLDPAAFFAGGEWYAFVDEACTENNLENTSVHSIVMVMVFALNRLFQKALEEQDQRQPTPTSPLSPKEVEAILKGTPNTPIPRIDPRTLPSVEKLKQILPYTGGFYIFNEVLTKLIAIAEKIN